MRISIFKRTGRRGARWYLDYYWCGERCRYPVADTRKGAEEIKARIQVQVGEGTFKGPHHNDPPRARIARFGALCDEWYGSKNDIRPATREFYQGILSVLKKALGTERMISTISAHECERLIARIRAESESPVRANRVLTVLRSLMRTAIRWEVISKDPTQDLKKGREPVRGRRLTREEQDAILGTCEEWFRPVVVAALCTGARRGDLLGVGKRRQGKPLGWGDVDPEGRTITFRQTKERRVRSVPIRDELFRVLRWLPSRRAGREVFVDDRGVPISPERAAERFRAAVRKSAIDKAHEVSFHDLRHTCGTTLLEECMPPHVVKEWLGHARLETTDKYAHAKLDDRQRYAKLADGHYMGTNPTPPHRHPKAPVTTSPVAAGE